MSRDIRVLHITAHLGGGIGSAIKSLTQTHPGVTHRIVCLETPEKHQFVEKIEASGTEIVFSPDSEQLRGLVKNTDIVQVEWWGHPVTTAALCRSELPPMRLLLWCHVSGLHTPVIPGGLIRASGLCILTSPCSLESETIHHLSPQERKRLAVIYSAGGLDALPEINRDIQEPLRAGYLGSLNFAKLHPDYVDFLLHVPLKNFQVRMIGDETNRSILEAQCRQADKVGMLQFRGYCSDVARELENINVMPYLLNPTHYGTSENALLEAMAMSVVPVVLDNPAERCLIEHGNTGLIIKNPEEFGQAILFLNDHPMERNRMANAASEAVRAAFSASIMRSRFLDAYQKLLSSTKEKITFSKHLGESPSDWFLNIQKDRTLFADSSAQPDPFALYSLMEQNKGSISHYARCFPEDPTLAKWQQQIISRNDLATSRC
jgi:glycosyltransferase involved in cell wall biosynthesis